MKHICNAISNGYHFGISISESIENPGMIRLIDEVDGSEIIDMLENEQEAMNAISSMFPDNDM